MNQEIKYHCSVKSCLFSEEKGKYFKRKMLMEQHFLNCHSERKHKCNKCGKCYAIDWQLKYHSKTCGLIWKCLTCDKSYKERLSLITHCKRHLHLLPSEAKRRKSKNDLNVFVPFNVILLPVISNTSQLQQSHFKPCYKPNQKQILPKLDLTSSNTVDINTQKLVNTSVQTDNVRNRRSSGTLKETSVNSSVRVKKAQTATQTEKITKTRASRSAQCPPVNVKKAKKRPEASLESTHTQTLESILLEPNSPLTLTKATSTCFSCNCGNEKSKLIETKISSISHIDSCQLSQGCIFSSPFIKPSNPLLCQFNNGVEILPYSELISKDEGAKNDNVIFEQSVQTDESAYYLFGDLNDTETQTSNEVLKDIDLVYFDPLNSQENALFFNELQLNDIETQTSNEVLNEIDLTYFNPLDSEDSELFFNELKLNDIETQTIWSKSQTTQTDNRHQDKDHRFLG